MSRSFFQSNNGTTPPCSINIGLMVSAKEIMIVMMGILVMQMVVMMVMSVCSDLAEDATKKSQNEQFSEQEHFSLAIVAEYEDIEPKLWSFLARAGAERVHVLLMNSLLIAAIVF